MKLSTRLLTGLLSVTLCSATFAALNAPAFFQEGAGAGVAKQHAMIQEGVGEWEGKITLHMPGMPQPEVAPCSEVVTSVGDYWTTTRFSMDFMGTQFSGSSTLGYDTVKKKFVGTWVDSMSPTLTLMEGDYDEEKKALVMHYPMYEPMTQTTKNVRSEHVAGEDSYTMSFYDVSEKGDTLTMKIEMKRK